MKKTTILILVLTLLITLSACGTQTGEGMNNKTDTAQRPSDDTALTTTQNVPSADSKTTENESTQTNETSGQTDGTNNGESEHISRESTIDIALQAAGLTRDSVYDLDAELEREPYGTYWEVDFETREREYSYHIDAITGAVINEESERND